jgi:hypothetical protein
VTDFDNETRAAIDALVYRLRNRGDADDEPFAQEYLAALKARGWRPVLAVPPGAGWRRASGSSRVPDAAKPGGADYLAAKAAITARVTGGQPVLTEGNDNRQEAS